MRRKASVHVRRSRRVAVLGLHPTPVRPVEAAVKWEDYGLGRRSSDTLWNQRQPAQNNHARYYLTLPYLPTQGPKGRQLTPTRRPDDQTTTSPITPSATDDDGGVRLTQPPNSGDTPTVPSPSAVPPEPHQRHLLLVPESQRRSRSRRSRLRSVGDSSIPIGGLHCVRMLFAPGLQLPPSNLSHALMDCAMEGGSSVSLPLP
ncbi:hypothetical protein CKAH01_02103 [Colletotrichum kahawae]|uniref:Uncharacterized protein n=1 Tax=Colletotrichum kahawae TaxID=34407 RepID=A0AAD9Y246_COLKA|nr:hypothetical protein CKAH01_02103 [Colletotrichum kahawae]